MQNELMVTMKKCQDQLKALEDWRRQQEGLTEDLAAAMAILISPEKDSKAEEREEWANAKVEVAKVDKESDKIIEDLRS